MFLLARACVPGMSLRGRSRGPCMRRFCFCGVLYFRFRGSVLLARCCRNCRGRVSVRLGGASCGLLFFFLLFRWFLDSAQHAKDFLALLGSLSATRELHGKNLVDNLVELRAPR